ncbi:MAG: hypothetical protein VX764_02185 [Planctomycetota bacterium]|nr:hypothetical protein [Planctomycetota bacterium]
MTAVEQLVAPLRINVTDRHQDFGDVTVMTKVPYSPRFRFFSCDQKRLLREWTGWLPTDQLVAEMHVARAIDLHERKNPLAAVEEYDRALERAPDGPAVAEIHYRRGMAAFLGNQFDLDLLRKDWQAVVEKHPGTRWAVHASVIEDVR